jgi:hypothetical protein
LQFEFFLKQTDYDKGSEEKMLQKGVYTGIIEKTKTTTSFAVSFFLDYKMVMGM